LAALHPARLHEKASAALGRLEHRLAWALGARSKRCGDQLAVLVGRLRASHPGGRLRLVKQQVEAMARQLESMSYRGVLGRGFSLTRGADGRIVRGVGDVREGDRLVTEVSDGSIASRVGEGESPGPGVSQAPPRVRKGKPKDDGPSLFDGS
jgi:exodeoxyribonuclease VII large subunit